MAVMGQLLKPKKTEITDKLRQEINKVQLKNSCPIPNTLEPLKALTLSSELQLDCAPLCSPLPTHLRFRKVLHCTVCVYSGPKFEWFDDAG